MYDISDLCRENVPKPFFFKTRKLQKYDKNIKSMQIFNVHFRSMFQCAHTRCIWKTRKKQKYDNHVLQRDVIIAIGAGEDGEWMIF